MKRRMIPIIIALALCMSLVLCACSDNSANVDKTETPLQKAATPSDQGTATEIDGVFKIKETEEKENAVLKTESEKVKNEATSKVEPEKAKNEAETAIEVIESEEEKTNTEIVDGEERRYCFPTLDDKFVCGRILVVLTHKASMELRTYAPEDFPEIECESIEDMMNSCTEELREWKENSNKDVKGLENRYHQILCINLTSKTKQGVIDAIRALDNRDGIFSAEPDWIFNIR